jgi:hypothetical protein
MQDRLAIVARFAATCARSGQPIPFMPTAMPSSRTDTAAFKPTVKLHRLGCGISTAGALDADAFSVTDVTIETDQSDQELTPIASVPLTAEPWAPFTERQVIVVRDGAIQVGLGVTDQPQSE